MGGCDLGVSDEIEFFCESLTSFDWSDGDVIFANSTCFSDTLMSEMADMAEKLKENAIFITFTKALPSELFEVTKKIRYKMSWGPATVFYHRKLANLSHDERAASSRARGAWTSFADKLAK